MQPITLRRINKKEDKEIFIKEIQEAFQEAYIGECGDWKDIVLPTEDIEESFNAPGAEIYFAEIQHQRIGGVVITVNSETLHKYKLIINE